MSWGAGGGGGRATGPVGGRQGMSQILTMLADLGWVLPGRLSWTCSHRLQVHGSAEGVRSTSSHSSAPVPNFATLRPPPTQPGIDLQRAVGSSPPLFSPLLFSLLLVTLSCHCYC